MDSVIIHSASVNPWHNLAMEDLMFQRNAGEAVLYLWQNQRTVVIGRCQNAWAECRTELLEQENGYLARRSSGGGAVYHDLGNLNFTFIVPKEAYDLERQLGVIVKAVNSCGIKAGFSGRNDILTESGAKFSGNAFRFMGNTAMQHGTLLIDVDMSKLGRYLTPSGSKLKAKGIKSVTSRVCNLKSLNKSLNIDVMKKALEEAFEAEYGPARRMDASELPKNELGLLEAKHSSRDWRFGGPTSRMDFETEKRFDWGEIQVKLSVDNGVIKIAEVYSDAMDADFISAVKEALPGCQFASLAVAARLGTIMGPNAQELARWLSEEIK